MSLAVLVDHGINACAKLLVPAEEQAVLARAAIRVVPANA
jgi:hypothetical protein